MKEGTGQKPHYCRKGDQEMKQMVLKGIDESLAHLQNAMFLETLLEITCIRTFSEIIYFNHRYLTQP